MWLRASRRVVAPLAAAAYSCTRPAEPDCQSSINDRVKSLRGNVVNLDSRVDAIRLAIKERKKPECEKKPLKILVTGFNDWRNLGPDSPPNVWRCRENPSCRLLVGAATTGVLDGASIVDGELTRRLSGTPGGDVTVAGRRVEWHFRTLPVTWSPSLRPFCDYCLQYDAVMHIGLGVYDVTDKILLERGAANARGGRDAAGAVHAAGTPLEPSGPAGALRELEASASVPGGVLSASAATPVAASLQEVDGAAIGNFNVGVLDARPANAYLCNETHFAALRALNLAANPAHKMRLQVLGATIGVPP
jgi:hypothetical protein